MSAQRLREAAALMRSRAGVAPESPWRARKGFVSHALSPGSSIADTVAEVFPLGNSEQQKRNAEHIASWHPAVALAVAEWLDSEADWLDRRNAAGEGRARSSWAPAIAVANAYLGSDQ